MPSNNVIQPGDEIDTHLEELLLQESERVVVNCYES